ncbi:hypothetical protein MNBD_GAMMA18-1990 [hydrothermal vent metagenome]|uniref:Uncharacterized protein n=1 Tax=hydrothermal vent metagenome TaxID=652676 RepID=A0A3B0ZVS7_9ZZZZ
MNEKTPEETEVLDWNSVQQTDLNDNDDQDQNRRRITTAPVYQSDKRFYQIVVWFLGLTMLICTLGAIGLASYDKEIPDMIVAVGSAAIGALAGLFAPGQR